MSWHCLLLLGAPSHCLTLLPAIVQASRGVGPSCLRTRAPRPPPTRPAPLPTARACPPTGGVWTNNFRNTPNTSKRSTRIEQ
eukprot:3360325-Pyramimonas_sp.AAC.1